MLSPLLLLPLHILRKKVWALCTVRARNEDQESRDHSTDPELGFSYHTADVHLSPLVWLSSTCTCWELQFKRVGDTLYVYGKSPFSFFCFKWEWKFSTKFVGEKHEEAHCSGLREQNDRQAWCWNLSLVLHCPGWWFLVTGDCLNLN